MRQFLNINKTLKRKQFVCDQCFKKLCAPINRSIAAKHRGLLRYRLYRIRIKGKECFFVEVRGLGSRAKSHLGTDAERAFGIYQTIVRNTVTPCTLRDVMEDLLDACEASTGPT